MPEATKNQRDQKASSPTYFRPQGYSNLQWICRVKKIMLNYNSMYIDDMVENPTQDILSFTEKISDTSMLPKEVFYEMYDTYVPDDTKAFDKFMDDHPGCLGISYKTGTPEPIYSIEGSENGSGSGSSVMEANRLLTFLNAMTNISMGNVPL